MYIFDTTGLLHLPGFVGAASVADLAEVVSASDSRVMVGRGDKRRYDDLASADPEVRKFVSDPAMRGCVEPLINQPYRLVESYALAREADSVFYFHNGLSEHIEYGVDGHVERNMSYHHTFHNGKLYCMLVKVLVYLSDVNVEADGPFCYLEGSHKANFSWFQNSIEKSGKPEITRENFPTLKTVFVKAGDAVIVNEALLHGTLPKSTAGRRLITAFTYAPIFVADWKPADVHNDDIFQIGHF